LMVSVEQSVVATDTAESGRAVPLWSFLGLAHVPVPSTL